MPLSLEDYVKAKRKEGLLYMPYLTIGDPSLEKSYEFALGMIDAGASLLELGIPFSDPIADGPVIQAAMERSLSSSISTKDIFSLCAKIHRARPDIPLIFLSYFNPIVNAFSFLEAVGGGEEKGAYLKKVSKNLRLFLKECKESGIAGLVIPDLPFDQPEAKILREAGEEYGVSQILIALPNTSHERLQKLCGAARAWIYYVSSLGVTGMRKSSELKLSNNLQRIRELTSLPLLAGFGFHEAEQVFPFKGSLDGVIVGSLNQSIIAKKGENAKEELIQVTRSFVQACKAK